MQNHPKLIPGQFFHLYNRGINSCAIFREEENYAYFFKLYEKHVAPVVTTYAWALLPTHFHFLVWIQEGANPDRVLNPGLKARTHSSSNEGANPDRVSNPVRVDPSHHFSKLFNAYAQAFNKRFDRHGSLFERPFKRKPIDSPTQLRNTLIYIHNNPVHHGYCRHPAEYTWSSYNDYLIEYELPNHMHFLQQMFNNRDQFAYLHEHSTQKLAADDNID